MPQNTGLGFAFGLAFGRLGLGTECCGLAGQVLALALAVVIKQQYMSSNI